MAPTGPVAFGPRFYTFVTLCPIPARGAGDDIFTGLTTGLLVSGPGCQIFKMPGKGRNRGTNDRAGCEIFKMPRREPRVKILKYRGLEMIFENAGSGAGFIFEKKAGDLPDRVPGRSLYFLPFWCDCD